MSSPLWTKQNPYTINFGFQCIFEVDHEETGDKYQVGVTLGGILVVIKEGTGESWQLTPRMLWTSFTEEYLPPLNQQETQQ